MVDQPRHHRTVGNRSLYSDQPVQLPEQDRLGRVVLADSIARAITRASGAESLVVALIGPWGSGKTSIKNLVLHALRSDKNSQPVQILNFQPWLWSGSKELSLAFLTEVGKAIGRVPATGERDARIAKLWDAYAARLRAGAAVAGGISKGILPIATVVALLSAGGATLATGAAKPFFAAVSMAAAIVALGLEWSGATFGKLGDSYRTRSKLAERTTEELRGILDHALRKRSEPMLVVVDDIDRLSSGEIAELFQLVKACADFPNLRYLLLFQRELVERSLGEMFFGSRTAEGRAYLEKIVQVPFTVPQIARGRLEELLLEGLNEIIADPAFDRLFDQHRWGNLFVGSIQYFFTSIRDVRRFLNTLDFHAGIFRGRETLEVNPIDLIGLEAMRVFEPDVYETIRENKELFVGAPFGDREEQRAEASAALEQIINSAHARRQQAVRELIIQLFPRTQRVLRNIYWEDQEKWARELRACHGEIFDRYFLFAVPTDDVTQEAVDDAISVADRRSEIRARLLAALEKGVLPRLLSRMTLQHEHFSAAQTRGLVTAIFDVGDAIPQRRPGLFNVDPSASATRLVHSSLLRLPNSRLRAELLATAISETDGIYLPVRYCSLMRAELRRPQPNSGAGDAGAEQGQEALAADAFVSDKDAVELEMRCVAKLREASKSGRLEASEHLGYLLFRWRDFVGDSLEPAVFARRLAASTQGALVLLRALGRQTSSHSAGDHVSRERFEVSIADIETFVPAAVLARSVEDVKRDELSESDAQILQAFLDALGRGRASDTER